MSDEPRPRCPLPFPDRSPSSAELPDPEPNSGLRTLLQRLPIPLASEELDARVMASYRREVARAGRGGTLFRSLDADRHRGPRWPVAALVAAGLFGVLLLGTLQITSSRVSAAELLEQARKQEHEWVDSSSQVVHRMVQLEERRASDARILTTRTIEIWQSAQSGIQARRVYDERDRLLAGEWRRRDGSSTLYRPHARPAAARTPNDLPLDAHEIWRWDLTASQFSQLLAAPRTAEVRRDGDTYVVAMGADPNAGIAGATLTMDANDFRPREASILIEQPDGAREYRFSEVAFEALPPAEVSPRRFEPDAELLAMAAPLEATTPRAARLEPPAAPMFSITELDRAELYAAYRLHRLANCLGSSAAVVRTPTGVQVHAPVISDACHLEASRAFSAAQPGLQVTVTPDRAQTETTPAAAIVDGNTSRMPGHAPLNEYFTNAFGMRSGGDAEPDEAAVQQAIRRIASWSVTRAQDNVRHASTLERLAERWSPAALQPLDLEAVAMWQAMVRDEARMIAQGAESLALQLQAPFQLPADVSLEPQPVVVRDATDVSAAVERLAPLVRETNEIVRRLFSPAPEDSTAPPLDRVVLAQLLTRTQAQAAQFAEPWVLNPGEPPPQINDQAPGPALPR